MLLLVLPVAMVPLVAGCSTFTDTDVAASVGDADLTTDELEVLVPAVNPTAPPTSADAVRNTISIWLLVQAISDRFDQDGIEITDDVRGGATERLGDPASGLAGWAELDEATRAELVEWQSVLEVLAQQPPEYREQAIAEADVEVSPRYGWFDPGTGVVPLGLPTGTVLG
jgi:hypothetical protein